MEVFRLVFSPIEVNTYILADPSGDCAIIDCGCYDNKEREEFEKFIGSRNLNPVLLLNTHCHLDHVFGNNFLLDRYGLKALASKDDEMNRKSAIQHSSFFGLSMDEPPSPGGFIEDNQLFRFGTTELVALHVPGHSAGSMAFYCEKDGCVFTGDALFAGSIGRTDLQGGSFDVLVSSIITRLFTLPPTTIVYPGHGEKTTIGRERMTNPYFS